MIKLAYKLTFTLILSLLITSCTVAYNSIQLKRKDDKSIITRIEQKSTKKKFRDNVVFVHLDGEILPLKNLEYNTSTTDTNSLSGETTMVDHNYEHTYYTLRNHKRDRMNELEVAGPKSKYFKQTHIFVDSITNLNDKVQIHENHIEKAVMYYKTRLLLYILLIVGVGGFLLIWFLIKEISELNGFT